MNNRQKAKHYKQLYERTLATQPLDLHVQNFKTEYIKTCTMIPAEAVKYHQISDYEETIKNELAHGLAEEIKKKMDVEAVYYPEQSAYKVYGLVRIVTGVYY